MLAPKPEIVLMDEPFSGLDAALRDEVRGTTLLRLKEAGTAVVMVTHDPDEAMRVGNRVALMRAGRIVQAGTPTEIYQHPADPQAAALFGGANVFHAPRDKWLGRITFRSNACEIGSGGGVGGGIVPADFGAGRRLWRTGPCAGGQTLCRPARSRSGDSHERLARRGGNPHLRQGGGTVAYSPRAGGGCTPRRGTARRFCLSLPR